MDMKDHLNHKHYINRKESMNKNPTPIDLASPEFNAIWNIIKKWDLERKPGDGYANANGTDVMTILNALRKANLLTERKV